MRSSKSGGGGCGGLITAVLAAAGLVTPPSSSSRWLAIDGNSPRDEDDGGAAAGAVLDAATGWGEVIKLTGGDGPAPLRYDKRSKCRATCAHHRRQATTQPAKS